jgi:CPA2 family monovalent cation:H+ antiporter-2
MEGDIHSGLGWLRDAVVYLGAVVIVAPICLRMQVSPILGYLLAGVLLGPHALGLIHEVEAAAHLAELGIVLLMFTIGLEISWQRLRRMAKQVFGVGMAQVLLTSTGFYFAARAMGLSMEASLLVGGALSLSSTAFVVRLLAERGALQSQQGRLVFSTLLFQDLAVAPMLAAAPLIAVADEAEMPGAAEILMALAWALIAVVGIIGFGCYAMRPALKLIDGLNNREVFAAASLLIVLATAWAGASAGLSMALGAFLAGMVLAGSGFRHKVENEVVPARGLLLGLFFMSIGALIDVGALSEYWLSAIIVTIAIIVFKTVVTATLARIAGFSWPMAIHVGLLLAQAGEFAFALTSIVFAGGLLAEADAQILFLATAISLVLTPGLAAIGARVDRKLESRGLPGFQELEAATTKSDSHVAIFGYGRAGQTLARVLEASDEAYIAVDNTPARVAAAAAQGHPVFYADAGRDKTLDMMGLESVRLAIVAMGDAHSASELVQALKRRRPDLPIYARARGQEAQTLLRAAGADVVVREVAESSLHMGGTILRGLGREREDVAATIDAFREDEYRALSAFLDASGTRLGERPKDPLLEPQTDGAPEGDPDAPKPVSKAS